MTDADYTDDLVFHKHTSPAEALSHSLEQAVGDSSLYVNQTKQNSCV